MSKRINENNAIAIVQKLIKLRDEETLTDVCLISKHDNQRFYCHRNVLAVGSDYFSRMLLSGFKESHSFEIYLDVPSHILDLIVRHLYSENITLTEECVMDMLKYSHEFAIFELIDRSDQFLTDSVDETNCKEYEWMAKLYQLPHILWKVAIYYDVEFAQKARNGSLTKMPFEEFKKLIGRDTLYVDSEESIFNAVEKWLKRDPYTRSEHAVELLDLIRFPLLSPNFINQRAPTFTSIVHPQFRMHVRKYLFDSVNWHLDKTSPFCGEFNSNSRRDAKCAAVFVIEGIVYRLRNGQWNKMLFDYKFMDSAMFAVNGSQLYYVKKDESDEMEYLNIYDLVKRINTKITFWKKFQFRRIMVNHYKSINIFGKNTFASEKMFFRLHFSTKREVLYNYNDHDRGVIFENNLYLLGEKVNEFPDFEEVRRIQIDFSQDLVECIAYKKCLYAFCASRTLQKYTFETGCWTRLNELPTGVLSGVQILADKILIAFNDGKTFIYNDDLDMWYSFYEIPL